jgi:hypothetical protein
VDRRAKGVQAGDAVDMERVERSSDNYTLGLAEFFLARNLAGRVLQGRIESLADDLRGADRDELCSPIGSWATCRPRRRRLDRCPSLAGPP